MQAISTGKITAGEGQQVMALLEGIRGNLETVDFERHLREIEQRQDKEGSMRQEGVSATSGIFEEDN